MIKIVVDTNIVFSAILNTNSKIGDLLLNSVGTLEVPATKSCHFIFKCY